MNFYSKTIVAMMAIVFAFFSCTNDDDSMISGVGNLKLEFDNVYGDANFAFDTEYINSNGEKIKADKVIYIVSNIVLTKTDNTTYTLPKNESYFFVNEDDAASMILTLPNIPAGNYTKVTFGVGVDQAQFEAGADGQGFLWTDAAALGMTWSWAAGYKFVKFEGFVNSTSHTNAKYRVHTGKTGAIYNYAEITLNLPDMALVRTTVTPQIHIMADLKKIVDGNTTINFEDGLDAMGGARVQDIMANNVPTMFSVHHVHND